MEKKKLESFYYLNFLIKEIKVKIMTYIIKFTEHKKNNNTGELKLFFNNSNMKCTSRKEIFESIPIIDEIRTRRWNYYLKDETIVCSNIRIFEPVYKKIKNGDKTSRIKIGMKEFSILQYEITYCRNCGRLLTDPISVARGIGPECIKHLGVNKLTNQYLDEKIKNFSEKIKIICNVLDNIKTKTKIIEIIKLNADVWMKEKSDRESIGIYLLRRFV